MVIDSHTPCVCCPDVVREQIEADEALLTALRAFLLALPVEHRNAPLADELKAHAILVRQRLRRLRPWYEAHHANQLHRDSVELADDRAPVLELPPVEPVLWSE